MKSLSPSLDGVAAARIEPLNLLKTRLRLERGRPRPQKPKRATALDRCHANEYFGGRLPAPVALCGRGRPRSWIATRSWKVLAALLGGLLAGQLPAAEERFTFVLPSFNLHGPAARQTLVVDRVEDGKLAGQITNGISFASEDPNIVAIQDGMAVARSNGTAIVKALIKGQTASARATVTGTEKPIAWTFRNDVQPVLAKNGCNAGACHGAAAGQNGFKLSLRGYDDDGDYRTITRQASGRRVVLDDPGRSLILIKPTGAVPHKGGTRFETGSLDYRILSEWLAAGAPGPKKEDPRVERIELLPKQVVVKPGTRQQLVVLAHFTDGTVRDVTRWAKYSDANASVTQVDDRGAVDVLAEGEGAITAWYLSKIDMATVTVPFAQNVDPALFSQAKRRNFIDDLVLEKLKSLNLPPSPACTDAEFQRRAYLDTIGVLPKPAETKEFLQSSAPDKRDKLIESLLARPEFVDYWTYKWSDLFLVNGEKLKPAAMWAYYRWIRQNVAANTPWDVLVRDVMTAKGSTLENGAANYFVLHEDPAEMAETTSAAFLGMSIACAKCHNHPMEKWTNDDYFGFANLFARVRIKNGSEDAQKIVFVSAEGELDQPLTGHPQAPRPLDGQPLPFDGPGDRREALAQWLTSRANPYFGRAIVNRVWANFFGVGLVMNVDDLRMTNPASNEKLLSAAANYLADQHFDLKALMRAILQSETYQRTSSALPENTGDTRFYSHYYPKRLMAEVMLDAISQVTGAPTAFNNYPAGWRALQLPDSNINSYFLKTFGRPERIKTCECERSTDPSISQVLHLANGDTINKKLTAKDNRLAQLMADQVPPNKLVEEAYLSALARYPTEQESEHILKVWDKTAETEKRPLVEDLYWAVLSSREFLFNH